MPRPLDFENGFLVGLDHRGTVTTLAAFLATSSTCFLRRLSAPGAQNVVRLLEGVGSKSLIELALSHCATPLDQSLASALPRVRRLHLTGILPRAIAWPGLEELAFFGHGARREDPAAFDAHLPHLLRLRITAREEDRARVLALARTPLPNLRALSFTGPSEIFRELAHAPWLERVDRIDLIRAGDDAIARLSQIASRRTNLRLVRVVAPHLSPEAKRALARLLSSSVEKALVS
jgi:hypothetical protein